ncbi:MAG: DNA repair protein RecO [Planctomycetota bacterium]|jgi:DNA repair protein RecO (recombination protein O)
MLEKDKAVCLRTVDYSETSQVVTLFTRDGGKLSAIAKGSRRPRSGFGGPIEIFSFGEIVYAPSRSAALATLTEFEQRRGFLNLRKNLNALNCAYFAAELLEAFTRELDPHADLFDSFMQFLTDIAAENCDAVGLLILFQLTLLAEIGAKPVISECANCHNRFSDKWREIYFAASVNGLVCPDCEQAFVDKIRLTKNAAAALADIKRISTTEEKTLNEIEKALIYYFTELMHRRPKMAKFFL